MYPAILMNYVTAKICFRTKIIVFKHTPLTPPSPQEKSQQQQQQTKNKITQKPPKTLGVG